MSSEIKSLNSIFNKNVLIHDEIVALKQALKQGVADIVISNEKLAPDYHDKQTNVGAWRRVDEYQEEQWRPLVKGDTSVFRKKLDII